MALGADTTFHKSKTTTRTESMKFTELVCQRLYIVQPVRNVYSDFTTGINKSLNPGSYTTENDIQSIRKGLTVMRCYTSTI